MKMELQKTVIIIKPIKMEKIEQLLARMIKTHTPLDNICKGFYSYEEGKPCIQYCEAVNYYGPKVECKYMTKNMEEQYCLYNK